MALDLTSKKSNYVSRLSAAVNANVDQIDDLVALYTEWLALDYGGAQAPADAIADADLNAPAANGAPAPFPHLSAATLGAVVASLAATKQFLDAGGHTANFLKMRP